MTSSQNKGEKADGYKIILFSFTVKLHANFMHNFKLLE